MSDTSGDPTPYDEPSSYALGETDVPPTRVEQPARRGRRSAHLTSVVLSLVLTPVALVAVDYALLKGWGQGIRMAVDDRAPDRALIAIGVAAVALLLVAALSRLSGLGPLLAGLVWGVLPSVGFALKPFTTAKRITELPDLYDQFLIPLMSVTVLFPVIGGVLVGVGLFGRWRGTKPAPVVSQP